ncbi:NAD-dependent dehydratase [bacterium]|jgi:UDP-glucuronate decarboxylase|nr:NAD-dependent dehydratase [bacterium]MDP6571639.1 GDP-mannose 4,6-dehydratase [Patescibacteria group bacterium]MDP6756459.1 GDP-mannose 4,6-dehydratase [Patescibacteria group bacterium]|tara:strand:+ start:4517 stop:5575 length:1059 start_codon:yes stop_codon:yes gene_type:complete
MPKIKGVFKKKNIVVIGGAGFIGSHICEIIAKDENARVICVDNLVTGTVTNIEPLLQSEDFKFIRHDITEPIDLAKFPELAGFEIEFEGIQEIYNCATPTSYKQAKRFAMETALMHSIGIKNILDLAEKHSAKVVHLSSSAIYGDPPPENSHFKEDYWGFVSSVDERAAYNEGKRFAETMCVVYSQKTGIDVKIARIFATYGPRMIMAEGRHAPDFVISALSNKDVVIHGEKDASSTFCYVKDTVEGIMKLMDSKEKGPMNIGSDDDHKLSDVAQKVIDVVGSKSKIKFEKSHSGMHKQGVPDIKLAKDTIGWFPVVKLDEGLKETVDYMRSTQSHYEQQGLWDESTLDRKE